MDQQGQQSEEFKGQPQPPHQQQGSQPPGQQKWPEPQTQKPNREPAKGPRHPPGGQEKGRELDEQEELPERGRSQESER